MKFKNKIWQFLIDIGFYKYISDEKYLKKTFKKAMKKELDLNSPKTFNEKLQWLKLNDREDIYTTMVDKYEVKKYVADIIGEEYIIPTLGVWDKFDDIDFDKLPNQFVLKCTHDSGGIYICKDKSKMNRKKIRTKFKLIMKRNFYYRFREWPYKNVKPRIIAEKYMVDESGYDLKDYKIFCFNGIADMILVCKDRNTKKGLTEDFFDTNWNHLNMKRPNHDNSKDKITKPVVLDKMLELSKLLANNLPFVRIDFYNISGKLYFGEFTFYPGGGMVPFVPNKWDYELGTKLILPIKRK